MVGIEFWSDRAGCATVVSPTQQPHQDLLMQTHHSANSLAKDKPDQDNPKALRITTSAAVSSNDTNAYDENTKWNFLAQRQAAVGLRGN